MYSQLPTQLRNLRLSQLLPHSGTAPGPAQIRPEVGSYLANQQAAQSMFVNTLFDRIGDRFNNADGNIDAA
ncbi:autotransporter outer membrane beta-barrel domain-containing protein [Enterobacter dykesii]|uniref:autotransporter outer membrane beta-barrel domain-containing protein n=1 Tax=Enterobacter dykesii TaxID=2797506 RepID=UPI001BDFD8C4|nr:autotransporter outer membrane beta-barrel domain-containing protein [Enterobacter dykesii]MBT1713645.1 autotransporter outer membrane beta-barrel domain-containing protein [Enterobacter dykesii]